VAVVFEVMVETYGNGVGIVSSDNNTFPNAFKFKAIGVFRK